MRSCIIMDEVMYGVMLNAKMEKFVNEPPVNASKKLKASPVCCAKNSLINVSRFLPILRIEGSLREVLHGESRSLSVKNFRS